MSATTVIDAERRLPYAPRDLCEMVGDVRTYPKFIPWIIDLKLSGEREHGGVHEAVAHVLVGWRAIRERFSTRVRAAPEEGRVDVTLVSGPFRVLENRWRFQPDGEGGSVVRFHVAYEFKSAVLNGLVRANRQKAADRIMAAFEKEAARRFEAPARA
jgi:coenzyme Q-binding protein COQ10